MNNLKEVRRDVWPTAQLGALCDIIIGRTPSRRRPDFWGGEHAWLSIADMNQGPVIRATKEKITTLGVSESGGRLIPSGTVLLSFKLSIGKVAVSAISAYTNEAIAALPILKSAILCRDFLFWALRSIRLDEDVGAAAKGKTLNRSKLERLVIPLPPVSEQMRIAAVLGKADTLLRHRQESLQLTEKLLQSVFIEMFGSETAPRCPRVRLLDHLDFITSGGRGWAKYYSTEGNQFIRSQDVQMNEINDSQMIRVTPPKNAEADRTRIRTGDVLLTITGSLIGRVAPVTEAHAGAFVSQHVAILRTHGFQPEFLSWAISTEEGQRQIRRNQRGQMKPGLNFEQIGRLTIPRPSNDLEETFTELIKRRRSILARQRDALEDTNKFLASLQQFAFRGELDLTHLVLGPPVDEPAAREPEKLGIKLTVPEAAAPFLRAPEATEAALKELNGTASKGEPVRWSADYFKYRILAAQPAPFSFGEVMQKAEAVFEQAPYEEIKDMILELLGQGGGPVVLNQRFDLHIDPKTKDTSGRKEIVFEPAT